MEEKRILVDRIYKRLADLGMSAAAASRAAGRSATFIRDLRDRPHSSPRSENLLALADVLACSPGYLLGETDEPSKGAQRINGFREQCQAIAFEPPPRRPGENHLTLEELPKLLCPSAKTPAWFKVEAAAASFGLFADDLVIVDLGQAPREGDLVVVSQRDEERGESTTVFRRYANRFLIPPEGGVNAPIGIADGRFNVVRGPVVAVVRAPDIISSESGDS